MSRSSSPGGAASLQLYNKKSFKLRPAFTSFRRGRAVAGGEGGQERHRDFAPTGLGIFRSFGYKDIAPIGVCGGRRRTCVRLWDTRLGQYWGATPTRFRGWFPPGCTFGTDGPCAWAKATRERSSRVKQHKSASGNTTLKFLPM